MRTPENIGLVRAMIVVVISAIVLGVLWANDVFSFLGDSDPRLEEGPVSNGTKNAVCERFVEWTESLDGFTESPKVNITGGGELNNCMVEGDEWENVEVNAKFLLQMSDLTNTEINSLQDYYDGGGKPASECETDADGSLAEEGSERNINTSDGTYCVVKRSPSSMYSEFVLQSTRFHVSISLENSDEVGTDVSALVEKSNQTVMESVSTL